MPFILLALVAPLMSGPYQETGINGYIDENGRHANPLDPNGPARLNPIFYAWATGIAEYSPAPGLDPDWTDPNLALGPATGENFDIVSLGDLDAGQIAQNLEPGRITFTFGDPDNGDDPNTIIHDGQGYDFAIFENGFVSLSDTGGGSISGLMFAELGYVEVSSDGNHFARFPSVSITANPTGKYGTIEISDVFNLVGKHPNNNGVCMGTPYDLQLLADHPLVLTGTVDLDHIIQVRIVDIPGSGDWYDNAMEFIDPNTWNEWDFYPDNHPIYDAWPTFGSSGVDVEAVGLLREQEYDADINLDGIVDIHDLLLFISAWQSHFGQELWFARCDPGEPEDLIINLDDFEIISRQWLREESWRDN
ncbi:MAG: hypothetical protein JW860_10905 [Sedimentisphaerales bacterium]|nr:hypothetical protein [Sedimentisphaerales bacterium]